jgi:DNA-binding SARP family transcriptional activator
LTVLALCAGQTVSSDLIIKMVWGVRTPATVGNSLQRHISYLRGALGSSTAIVAESSGYRLDLGAVATDVLEAELLITKGRAAGSAHESADYLRTALALWRGEPLADVRGETWFGEHAERLERMHRTVVTALVEARLALGEYAELIPDLEGLIQQAPFDEDLHGQLMLALYRCGRQADALATYQQIRRRLADELGLDPGPRLRDLEHAVLRQDPDLEHGSAIGLMNPWSGGAGRVPIQLPSNAVTVVGRDAELEHLDDLLSRTDFAATQSAAVFAISGMAGVGKTTLAVRWAHLVADQFPDGQIYVNLRSNEHARPPMDSGEALDAFLTALGVPPGRLPPNAAGQIGMYRTLLAGRRILVLLDDAVDAAQVLPLLPNSPGCIALVLSRTQLTPLVVTENAYSFSLEPLAPSAAGDLLETRLGPQRMVDEAASAQEIIHRCAGLPLALAIAGSQLVSQPPRTLTSLADQMRSSERILDIFNGGDSATDLRTGFSSSYRALSGPAATLFRLFGLHDQPSPTTRSAAALSGLTDETVRPVLTELTRQHFLNKVTDDEFHCHPLLYAYARELARVQLPVPAVSQPQPDQLTIRGDSDLGPCSSKVGVEPGQGGGGQGGGQE